MSSVDISYVVDLETLTGVHWHALGQVVMGISIEYTDWKHAHSVENRAPKLAINLYNSYSLVWTHEGSQYCGCRLEMVPVPMSAGRLLLTPIEGSEQRLPEGQLNPDTTRMEFRFLWLRNNARGQLFSVRDVINILRGSYESMADMCSPQAPFQNLWHKLGQPDVVQLGVDGDLTHFKFSGLAGGRDFICQCFVRLDTLCLVESNVWKAAVGPFETFPWTPPRDRMLTEDEGKQELWLFCQIIGRDYRLAFEDGKPYCRAVLKLIRDGVFPDRRVVRHKFYDCGYGGPLKAGGKEQYPLPYLGFEDSDLFPFGRHARFELETTVNVACHNYYPVSRLPDV